MFLQTAGPAANPTWSFNGSGLTSLNASNLASGTVPSGVFSGTYTGALTFSSAANVFTAAYKSTDGSSGLTQTCTNFTGTSQIVIKNGLITSITGPC